MDDACLLQSYARDRDQAAFATLVRRQTDLVYSAALRRMNGDPHAAQEVTQRVFLTLARKADSLIKHPALPAWLHLSTRNAAIDLQREQTRRRARETAALTDAALTQAAAEEPAVDWSQLAPVLDDALDTLGETDRQTILLRYFVQQPFADIAARLGTTEAAAQMRATRALEKLRRALAKRGVTSTASALGLALTGHAVTAAPASVAASTLAALTTSAAVVASTAATSTSSLTLLTTMTTSTKLTLGVSATVLAAVGIGWDRYQPNSPAQAASVPSANVSSVPSNVASNPVATTTSPKPLPAEAAASAQAAVLAQKLSDAEKALKAKRVELALNESWTKASLLEAASRAQMADPTQSVFPSLDDAGLYVVRLHQLNQTLSEKYPLELDPDSPLFADYLRDKDAFNRDLATLVQDPLFVGALRSSDPVRVSTAQTAYIAPALKLDNQQKDAVRLIVENAHREANTRQLGLADRPAENDTAWQAGRDQLGAQAAAKIKALLTPEQRARYDSVGFDDPVFKFSFTPRKTDR